MAARPQLSLQLLGDGISMATVDDVRHELSLRHAEIRAVPRCIRGA
ncbi:hypothetical protein [Saccharopolyspora elongata]|nr:hypothetical protein [Saccharopolyspora elongata]